MNNIYANILAETIPDNRRIFSTNNVSNNILYSKLNFLLNNGYNSRNRILIYKYSTLSKAISKPCNIKPIKAETLKVLVELYHGI